MDAADGKLLGDPERRLMLIRPFTAGSSRGFSLIEAVIAIGILTIALALGAPAFSIWIKDTQIRAVAESIQNGLQVARNEALRRNTQVEFVLNADTGWTVTAKIPEKSDEQIEARPSTEASSSSVTATLEPDTASKATFDGFGRIVNTSALNKVTVASSLAGTRPLTVQISAGGRVRMCDDKIDKTSTDPRKCE